MTSKVPWWSGDIRNFSNEEFQGYFSEIRSVALRTLPRQPPKGLLTLLRIDKYFSSGRSPRQDPSITSSPRSLADTKPFTFSPRELQLDLLDTYSTTDASINYFPVSTRARLHKWDQNEAAPDEQKESACTRVEKTILGISAYLGIAILVLIIVVGVLITSLKSIDDNINELKEITGTQNNQINSPGDPVASSTSAITGILTSKIYTTAKPQLFPSHISTSTTAPSSTSKTTISLKSTSSLSEPSNVTTRSSSSSSYSSSSSTTISTKATTLIPPSKPTTASKETTLELTDTPNTTDSKPTTTSLKPSSRSTTTTTEPSTTKSKTTTPRLTPKSSTTSGPPTTTPKPTTTTPKPTTTTPKPTTSTPKPTTTTPKPTTTTPKPTTTTPKPTTTTPKPTTTTPKPTTTTPKPTTTTPKPTTTTPKPTTTTPKPTTTTPQPTTTTTVPTTTTTENPVCESNYCNSLAYEMLSRINSTINPCSDFYRYACGAWITSRQSLIQQGLMDTSRRSTQQDASETLLRRIKDMLEKSVSSEDSLYASAIKLHYQSCLASNTKPDSDKVSDDVKLSLELLGMDQTYDSYLSVSDMQSTAFMYLKTDALFSTKVVQGVVGGKSYHILQISPPPLFLNKKDYDDPLSSNDVANSYVDTLATLVQRFLSSADGKRVQRRSVRNVMNLKKNQKRLINNNMPYQYWKRRLLQAQDDVDPALRTALLNMFKFERQLAQSISATSTNSPETIQISLAELSERYPQINWRRALPNEQSDSIPLQVQTPAFFYGLDRLVNDNDKKVIKMYIYTRALLFGVWPYLPLKTRSLIDGLGRKNVSEANTWKDCLNSTLHILSEESQNEFALRYSNTVAVVKEFLTSLYRNITQEIERSFNSIENYSIDTKTYIQSRLQSLSTKFQPISEIPWTVTLSTSSQVDYSTRALFGSQARVARDLRKVGTVVEFPDIEWYRMEPLYDSNINVIGIPLALITEFGEFYPQFPVFANVGWRFSKEVTHAVFGSMTDGLPPDLWSTLSRFTYQQVLTCFSNQLSESNTDESLFRTGMVMAGHGGLQIIRQEFDRLARTGQVKKKILPRLSYTEDQLFYLSFVQNHCEIADGNSPITNHYRINNILRNDRNFGAVFQCPNNSIMSPVGKCSLL